MTRNTPPGVLLLVAAGAQLGAAIGARDWSGFFLFLLVGVLYAVAGFFTLQQPVLAAESLTLMLAATFVVSVTRYAPAWVVQNSGLSDFYVSCCAGCGRCWRIC
jgi:uncharacterized membrane protein HdeD (DUF308 family)